MKTVKELMVNSPKFCGKHEGLENIVKEMTQSKIGSLPVVDTDKKVIGFITDRDVCVALGTTHKPLSELKVYDAMTTNAHTCTPEDNAITALKIMRTKKVGRLPVVDKEGHIKGIISLNTIVRQLHNTNEHAEIEYQGEENVVNTLHSIALRNSHLQGYEKEHVES